MKNKTFLTNVWEKKNPNFTHVSDKAFISKKVLTFCIDHIVTQHRKLYWHASPGFTKAQAQTAGKVLDPG